MIDPEKILFLPSTRRGNGTGHLKRCIDWGEELGSIHLYAADKGLGAEGRFSDRDDITWHDKASGRWDLAVLDNRETESIPHELKSVPLAAVDESGRIRESASYTIDIIPGGRPGLAPNLQGLSFMKTPDRIHSPGECRKILVCFGGEDPAGLSSKLLKGLSDEPTWSTAFDWHIISKELMSASPEMTGLDISESIPDLRSIIPDYDLVLCSYGLTAFEALAAEVPVILFNPGSYHDKLSRSADLSFLPRAWRKSGAGMTNEIKRLLKDPGWMTDRCRKQFENYRPSSKSLPQWLKGMTITRDSCPACGSGERKALSRFENKSYFQCSECSMLYMVQFKKKDEIYTEDYFFSEYKSQYGKTYIEDFEAIAVLGRNRLSVIEAMGKSEGNLLDIGCAYGPFLREARDTGFQAYGLEIAPEAVEYIRKNLPGIKAETGSIEDPASRGIFKEAFDVITFWYVIEHMQKLDEVLPRVAAMLNPGGLLCLGTPCGRGISALKNRREFLRRSPEDHYTVWTRSSARRILKRYGFSRIRFKSTGHHPERFPDILNALLPFSLRLFISRLFGLGDSFEIYAIRDKS